MTDMAPGLLDYWRQHDQLRLYIERDLIRPVLSTSETDNGIEGWPSWLLNPVIVIANYVFDSTAHGTFFTVAGNGKVEERLATLHPSTRPDAPPGATPRRVVGGGGVGAPPFRTEALDETLARELARRTDGTVMFPVAALRCVDRLAAAAGGRLMLLASDLGVGSIELLPPPEMEFDGFMFVPCDLDLIGRYVAGDRGLHRFRWTRALDACVAVRGIDAGELPGTGFAFTEHIERFGARGWDTLFDLTRDGPRLAPEQWMAVAGALRYDSFLLAVTADLPAHWAVADLLNERHAHGELLRALRRFGGEIYPIPGSHDAYYDLGRMLSALGAPRDALTSFVKSIEAAGPSARTFLAMALDLRTIGRLPEALEALRDALEADPSHVLARGWMAQIEIEIDQ